MPGDYKLNDNQLAELRLATDAHDLARRWNCSVSTARRRVRKAWAQVLPEAMAALERAQQALKEVHDTEKRICKTHAKLTYYELHDQLVNWKVAAERARCAPNWSYLVWRAIGRKRL